MQRKSKYIKTFEEFDSFSSHQNYEKYKNVPQEGEKLKKKKKYSIPPNTQNSYDPSTGKGNSIGGWSFGGL